MAIRNVLHSLLLVSAKNQNLPNLLYDSWNLSGIIASVRGILCTDLK